jgi:protein-disulfide isomerase
MRSRLIPLTILLLGTVGLGWAIVSIAVGERELQESTITGSGEVQELIGGIRQLENRLGDEGAPVTVTVFNDVQCPRCADYQAATIDPLIADYARTGEVKLEFRHFPLGLQPVTLGAVAAEAAGEQDRQWQYLSIFMRNLDQVPETGVDQSFLNEVAGATPKLDVAAWEQALQGEEARARAQEDVELATELRLSADPALIVEGAAGSETLEETPSLDQVAAAIDRVG